MHLRSVAIAAMALGSSFALTPGANASPVLTGTVTADYLFPDTATVDGSSVLTAGTPLNCPGGFGNPGICYDFITPTTITVSGLTITLQASGNFSYNPAAFNGLQFSGLTFDDGSHLTGFTLGGTSLAGLTDADVSFTDDSIEYNLQGNSFTDGPNIVLNLITNTSANAVPVPEPGTLSIFGAALACAAVLRRRKKAMTA